MKLLCDVYKSKKMDEAYLYVSRQNGLDNLPEALLDTFGKPTLALTIVLTPEKKLARAQAPKVLEQIAAQGFYLQMPPPKDEYLIDIDLFCKLDLDEQ